MIERIYGNRTTKYEKEQIENYERRGAGGDYHTRLVSKYADENGPKLCNIPQLIARLEYTKAL